MADIITTQDPLKPGVTKLNGPTLTAGGSIPLSELDTTGAVANDVISLVGGAWTPQAGAASADTASNIGAGTGVFSSKVGADFQFKSLVAGANITITPAASEITIASSAASGGDIVILEDQKAQNTNGGTFTSGAWRTRDLNTEVVDTGGVCTLAANQFTLDAGTYEILAFAPSQNVNGNQARLYNITDASIEVLGSTDWNSLNHNTRSVIIGRFTIAAAKTFEIQHFCNSTATNDGFGKLANISTEVYTQVFLRKVA